MRKAPTLCPAGLRSPNSCARGLNEVVGQDHLTGPGGALRTAVEKGRIGALVFWEPPGTGKGQRSPALWRRR